MIEKLEPIKAFNCSDTPQAKMQHHEYHNDCIKKINELVDAVNELHAEAEDNARIRANHEKLIDTLVKENNIHEKQIDELQMKVEPEKCEIPVDQFAEQRKWIWHLCRFWFDDKKQADIGILGEIDEDGCYPYWNVDLGQNYKHCEPVKPDDDIIYKGGDNE